MNKEVFDGSSMLDEKMFKVLVIIEIKFDSSEKRLTFACRHYFRIAYMTGQLYVARI